MGTALVVLDKKNDVVIKSARNIKGIKLIPFSQISIHDVFKYEKIVMTKDAFKEVEKKLNN